MPTIDELLVRIDADLKPLTNKLREADILVDRSVKLMNAKLQRVSVQSRTAAAQTVATSNTPAKNGPGTDAPPIVNAQFQREFDEAQSETFGRRAADLGLDFLQMVRDPLGFGANKLADILSQPESFDIREFEPQERAFEVVELEKSIRFLREVADRLPGFTGDSFRDMAAQFEAAQAKILQRIDRELQASFTSLKLLQDPLDRSFPDGSLPEFQNRAGRFLDTLREAEGLAALDDEEISATLEKVIANLRTAFEGLEATIDDELVRSAEELSEALKRLEQPSVASQIGKDLSIPPEQVFRDLGLGVGVDFAREICTCLEQAIRSSSSRERGGGGSDSVGVPGGGFIPAALRLGGERGGGLSQAFVREPGPDDFPRAGNFGSGQFDNVEQHLKVIDAQAEAWRAVVEEAHELPPALTQAKQKTVDLSGAARDLGFTFASAFEDAIVEGESFSDILQALEKDILRILTRLLITEPLARGIASGLGAFTGGGLGAGGGLEGLIGGGLGSLANLFPSPVPGLGLGSFNKLTPIAAADVSNPLLAGIFQSGGPVSGRISGPGGPRGDRIPALLSDGEFVVNARATRQHRRLLEAVNANRLRGLAEGGLLAGGLPEIPPVRPAMAPPPQRGPALGERPIVVNINNPTSVPQIQQGMAQIRGSLREMLARAERRDS